MLIDTHSHLNFKAYDQDREEVIKRTREAGVICIDVGTKYETSKNAVELAEKNEEIYAAIGMHPIHIKTDLLKIKMDEDEGAFAPLGEEYDKEAYKKLALSGSRRVVAVGEVGLDYYYRPKGTAKTEKFKEKQRQVFKEQLDLAKDLGLPVIIHCRMAHEDVLDILKSEVRNPKSETKLRGVIHCFTGNWEQAQKYIELGFHLGINGIIFKFDIDDIIKKAPLDKILVETDCPYLTPPLARRSPEGEGGRNEPIFVKYVAQRIADLRGIGFQEVSDKTTENAKKLFDI